jgi:adenine-specific DNA-methyltransferase
MVVSGNPKGRFCVRIASNMTQLPFDIVAHAAESGRIATAALPKNEQKALGQFLTPPGIARFMAQRCIQGVSKKDVHILEPAAGAGILAAAAVEALLLQDERPISIKVTLCELDPRLFPGLKGLAVMMRKSARSMGVKMSVSINMGDFLLSPASSKMQPVADVIIANPPYFKISAKDQRAIAHAYAVYGQPNIYGLFMAACSSMVKPGGRW